MDRTRLTDRLVLYFCLPLARVRRRFAGSWLLFVCGPIFYYEVFGLISAQFVILYLSDGQGQFDQKSI